MNSSRAKVLFLLLLLVAGGSAAWADLGPKPTMDFEFQFSAAAQGRMTAVSGVLYGCKADGSNPRPLEPVGPQRFTCGPKEAHAMAYGFAEYNQLRITFSDGKTRKSNVFQATGMKSRYRVTVRSGDLLVVPIK